MPTALVDGRQISTGEVGTCQSSGRRSARLCEVLIGAPRALHAWLKSASRCRRRSSLCFTTLTNAPLPSRILVFVRLRNSRARGAPVPLISRLATCAAETQPEMNATSRRPGPQALGLQRQLRLVTHVLSAGRRGPPPVSESLTVHRCQCRCSNVRSPPATHHAARAAASEPRRDTTPFPHPALL